MTMFAARSFVVAPSKGIYSVFQQFTRAIGGTVGGAAEAWNKSVGFGIGGSAGAGVGIFGGSISLRLVEKPEDWLWSSFRHYATGVDRTVQIESQWAASRRGNEFPQHLRSPGEAG
jgi:hypothetical protein